MGEGSQASRLPGYVTDISLAPRLTCFRYSAARSRSLGQPHVRKAAQGHLPTLAMKREAQHPLPGATTSRRPPPSSCFPEPAVAALRGVSYKLVSFSSPEGVSERKTPIRPPILTDYTGR